MIGGCSASVYAADGREPESAMHELPMVMRLLNTVSEAAGREHLTRITCVNIRIGELSDLADACMQLYWETASEHTVCDGAVLNIRRAPARLRCLACGKVFPHLHDFVCPECGGEAVLIRGTGEGCVVESLEGE